MLHGEPAGRGTAPPRRPGADLPQQSTADAQADLDAFLAIKKQRDNIAHGGEFDEPRLPLAELNRLLMKYLAAHADRTRLKPLSSGLDLSP